MARIRQCLTPSKGIELVNKVIKGTKYEKQMLTFKQKYCLTFDTNQFVGYVYWRGFMKRNQHLLVTTKGKKYELNRDNWCTYTNMKAMYDHIIEEMIDSNLAMKLEEPVWMNESGNHVSNENNALGCKVTHQILHPDWCLIGNKTGGNLNVKGDGQVGGEKFLTGQGFVPQAKASATNHHFAVI